MRPASRTPLPAGGEQAYVAAMTQVHDRQDQAHPALSRTGIALMAGGAFALLAAGLLLWWREGDRLFTDGLIAALIACF